MAEPDHVRDFDNGNETIPVGPAKAGAPPPGGCFAVFEFPDKTELRVDIAHATAHVGGGDHSIGVSKWVLSKGLRRSQ